jgi:hypothetical protein
MSVHSEMCMVALPLDDVRRVCRDVVAAMSWQLVEENTCQFRCSELARAVVPQAFRIAMEITLHEVSPTLTRIAVSGSNIGRSTAQAVQVKSRVRRLRDQLHSAALAAESLACRADAIHRSSYGEKNA